MQSQSKGENKSKSKSQIYSDLVFKNIEVLVAEPVDSTRQAQEKKLLKLKKYKSLCKRGGGILRTVGLIHFLTFIAAKATKESELHHKDLLEHLRVELFELHIIPAKNETEFLSIIRQQELPEYMRTTSETLKLLQWHKRISDILISGTVGGD